jgi:hypothetical protein
MRYSVALAAAVLIPALLAAQPVRTSYGNDFMSTGGGARALAMGGAFTAVADDATGGFWNPAGLLRTQRLAAAFMHSERFNGAVQYDYAAAVWRPETSEMVFGLSFFRQGVDGIKNTLNAWDRDRDRPVNNPGDAITEFTAADMALMASIAAPLTHRATWGANLKLIHRRTGPFAQAWGYSLDLGTHYRNGPWRLGLTAVDITTLLTFWSVDASELEPLRDFFSDDELNEAFPTGQTEVSLPYLRTGVAWVRDVGDLSFTAAADADLMFDGRDRFVLNLGPASIHPRVGIETAYLNTLFFRVGLADISTTFDERVTVSPALGTGFRVGSVTIDYGFGSFVGNSSVLGNTHRISASIQF